MAAEEAAEAARLLRDALSAVEVIVRNQHQTGIVAVGSPQEATSSGAQLPFMHSSSSQPGGSGRPRPSRSMGDFVTRAQENFR